MSSRPLVRALGLALALLPALAPAARAAGPLASGAVVTGAIAGPSFTESWTFTGTAGQRVIIGALTTSGSLNTVIDLLPPGGGPAVVFTSTDRVEYQLLASGTYTLNIEDLGLDTAGSYSLSFVNLQAGPWTNAGDLDGGILVNDEIRTAQMNTATDFDVFTFTGVAGDRILLGAVATAAAVNTTFYIYPPNGGASENSTGGDRLDHTLQQSGTYTVLVEDLALDSTGGYSVWFMNLSSGPLVSAGDPDGGPITSAEIKSGTMSATADFDVYRFSGAFGERVVLGAVTTSGTLNTVIAVYPPTGAPAIYTSSDRAEYQLPATGNYLVVIEDLGDDATGAYALSLMNLSVGPFWDADDHDGGALASSSSRSGLMQATGDFDAYTITGNAGDRILLGALATSGSMNTTFYVYPPGGGAAENSSGGDRLDHTLLQSGTYTILVEDQSLDTTGGYILTYLNLTAGPFTSGSDLDGGPIASAETKAGQVHTAGDFDAWRFTGTVGDRVLVAALAGGGALNTIIAIYGPEGPPVVYTSSDRVEYQLVASGLHTIVVEDLGNDATGPYTLGLLNVTAGPLSNGADPNGGGLVSSQALTGQMNTAADFDAFTFSGVAGHRILLSGLTTGGTMNTTFYLYPPGGGAAETSTGGDRLEQQLLATGTYTVVMEDQGNDNTGTYQLAFLDLTSGPFTAPGDADGGAIVSGITRTGQMQGVGDFDAYQVTGGFGQRVIVGALTTAGTLNTVIGVYPPVGPAAVYTSSDRVELQLASSGTYTIVIEDLGLDDTGSYTLGLLNVSAGPHTSPGDLDGGPLASAAVTTGQMNDLLDLDAFTFSGKAGDRVVIGGLTTGGTLNTTFYVYPPSGGPAEASTGGDRLEVQLAQTGTYTLVMEDQGFDNTGTYGLTLVNLGSGPLSSIADPNGGILARGQVRSGQIGTIPDFDVYEFHGTAGDTAKITCVTTAGPMNSQFAVYPPGGGVATVYTSADLVNYILPFTGYYAILVEDAGLDQTGSYDISLAGSGGVVGTGDDPRGATLPDRVALAPAAPSPFAAATTLAFALPASGPVELRIFDVRGALVRTLVHGDVPAGTHRATWDGRDDAGRDVPSGVYWAALRAGHMGLERRLVRTR